ncbi:MAG: glycosyltransferase family A protein [Planctomycetota bacterium]
MSTIAIISPVRNEAHLLPQTIASMVAQTVHPDYWVIVDDGSSDATLDIAHAAAAMHSWIKVVKNTDRGKRVLGAGVIQAFKVGYNSLDIEPDFIGKLDGDMTFGPKYIETLLSHFSADPKLGAASGKVFRPEGADQVEEFMIDEMVAGQFKFYRHSCWKAIGGFVEAVMWDGIDFHRARQLGWTTLSILHNELRLIHHRLMGSSDQNVLKGRVRWGKGQWFMGSSFFYILASAAFRMLEKPVGIGGMCILGGYLSAMLRREPRFNVLGFRSELQHWQQARLINLIWRRQVR